MSPDLQAVLDAMNAERYGRSAWWKRTPAEYVTDDSELTCGMRRRAMGEDFDRAKGLRSA